MHIALISCGAKKKDGPAMAKDMYIGSLFKGAYRYARKINADKIFILSAKYGLLEETDLIEPYNETLNTKSTAERKIWAQNVIKALSQKADLQKDEFTLLAGEKYCEYLIDSLRHFELPLKGLDRYKQSTFYKENCNVFKICKQLHTLIRKGKRFDFNMGYDSIPDNGIYIMFEKGEFAHDGDRIVRIGTHTGDKQLRSRIYQHFENENKNRSIFRKNIGRCILTKEQNPYLSTWELDTTSKKNKELFTHLIDKAFEIELEKKISQYIQENLSFCLLEVPSKKDRLHYEARLIGTVSGCTDCLPSNNWLGQFSPVDKIKQSGLWQVKELYSQPLSKEEFAFISDALICTDRRSRVIPQRNHQKPWDLYNQQPILMLHPQDLQIAVAGVTINKRGELYVWDADYLISANLAGGLANSGFPYTPFDNARPVYFEDDNTWRIDKRGRTYIFKLPTEEMMIGYEAVKHACPSIAELVKLANEI